MFGSFTADLHRMARWLKDCRIATVVMQSTGVYWMALHDVLESHGLQVNVANARHTKTLPGRKTDVQASSRAKEDAESRPDQRRSGPPGARTQNLRIKSNQLD